MSKNDQEYFPPPLEDRNYDSNSDSESGEASAAGPPRSLKPKDDGVDAEDVDTFADDVYYESADRTGIIELQCDDHSANTNKTSNSSNRRHVYTQVNDIELNEDGNDPILGTSIRFGRLTDTAAEAAEEQQGENPTRGGLSILGEAAEKHAERNDDPAMAQKVAKILRRDDENDPGKKKHDRPMTRTERKNQSKILARCFKEVAAELVRQANIDQQHENEQTEQEFEQELGRLATTATGAEPKYSKKTFLNLLKKTDKNKGKLTERSMRIYKRYSQIYNTYLRTYELSHEKPESLTHFLFLMSYHYAGSSMWTLYSSIRWWYGVSWDLDIKNWPGVIRQMKSVTKNHVGKQAKVFTKTEMNEIFRHLEAKIAKNDWEGHKARSMYVGINMAYYGLCRVDDLLKIRTEDFHREENEQGQAYYIVRYESRKYESDESSGDEAGPQQAKEKRKNTTMPFEFDLPTYATKHIDDMIRMTPSRWHHRRMIKNANSSAKNEDSVYSQNMGESNIRGWAKELAETLFNKPDASNYTGHTWRRTGATTLADEGITEIALKRAGNWTSATAAMKYVNASSYAREKQVKLLEPSGKKSKLASDEANTAIATAASARVSGQHAQNATKSTSERDNRVQVVDGLTANHSNISMTTNIIITAGTPAEIVGNIMAQQQGVALRKNFVKQPKKNEK